VCVKSFIDFIMIQIPEEKRYVVVFYYKKGKNAAKHAENFVKYTVKMLSVNEGLRSGLFDPVPEICVSKMHLALVYQSLEKSKKFCNWCSKTTR